MPKLPSFPSIDLSHFDLGALRHVDLPHVELPHIELPSLDTAKVGEAVRDAAYVAIGFGVLTFQQAQVRRRELTAAVGRRLGSLSGSTR